MALQLGLGSISDSNFGNGQQTPPIIEAANSTVTKEECIRTYWMIEILEIISMTGGPLNFSTPSPIPPEAILPCRDFIWALPKPSEESSLINMRYSSGLNLCIGLAIDEVMLTQIFMQTSVNTRSVQEVMDWESKAQNLDERLTNWREEFVAAVFRLINAGDTSSEMDPFITLTNCVLNT